MNIILLLFYLSFILIRLPPLLLPFGLTTHIIFRLINLIILSRLILFYKKQIAFKGTIALVIIFFVFQSLSIINTININTFLYFFERLIAIVLFTFISFLLIKKEKIVKTLIYLLSITALINVLLELIMFFNPLIVDFLYSIIHQSVLDIFVFNINRGRLYFESYGEVFLPVIVYLFLKEKTLIKKIIYWFTSLGIILLAFWSNYRDRFVVVCFSVFLTLIIFRKDLIIKIKQNAVFLVIAILIFIAGFFYIYQTKGYSVIDRILLLDKEEDIYTLNSRIELINEAISIGTKYPIFGVGLGNYYEHLPFYMKNRRSQMIGQNKVFFDATLLYPHNLFAQVFVETGLLGLISFISILIYLFIKDTRILLSGKSVSKALIISFWALVLYAMFNPRTYLTFYINFFIIRILIEIINKKYD